LVNTEHITCGLDRPRIVGFGYGGVGYQGRYWNNGAFNYNRSVNNVDVTNIHNVYNKTVINNTTVNYLSYNGGAGGITARPTQAEETAAREQHSPPTAQQTAHVQAASTNLGYWEHIKPYVATSGRPRIVGSAASIDRLIRLEIQAHPNEVGIPINILELNGSGAAGSRMAETARSPESAPGARTPARVSHRIHCLASRSGRVAG